MTYTKKTWVAEEVINAADLNNMEDGIEDAYNVMVHDNTRHHVIPSTEVRNENTASQEHKILSDFHEGPTWSAWFNIGGIQINEQMHGSWYINASASVFFRANLLSGPGHGDDAEMSLDYELAVFRGENNWNAIGSGTINLFRGGGTDGGEHSESDSKQATNLLENTDLTSPPRKYTIRGRYKYNNIHDPLGGNEVTEVNIYRGAPWSMRILYDVCDDPTRDTENVSG